MSSELQQQIHQELRELAVGTAYAADANEPDPRYRGYGVRMPAMRALIKKLKPAFRKLDPDERLPLATALIDSGYGEQKTVALELLNSVDKYFTPDKLSELEAIFRKLWGWSKIDAYTGTLLSSILERYPAEVTDMSRKWSQDEDLWLRRASVVLYTRKVAKSGKYMDVALENCETLKFDPEDMVQKGVGWCLKDLMKADQDRVADYVMLLREQKVPSVITLYAIRDLKGDLRQKVLAAGP